MNSATKIYEEISEQFGSGESCGTDPVAQYTGEDFIALDLTAQTTEVMLAVVGSDETGWIVTTWDIYADGESTDDVGTSQAGKTVYLTRDAAIAAVTIFVANK